MPTKSRTHARSASERRELSRCRRLRYVVMYKRVEWRRRIHACSRRMFFYFVIVSAFMLLSSNGSSGLFVACLAPDNVLKLTRRDLPFSGVYSMNLVVDLPHFDQLVLPHAADQFATLAQLEQTCKTSLSFSRQDNGLSWRKTVKRRWGPVASSSKSWRELAMALEQEVRPLLNVDVAAAVKKLEESFLPPGVGWHETLRRCASWCTLLERRRIVAFVCAERHSKSTLAAYLSPIPIRGATPEVALRHLLLVFPFLPIDAGQGADHVIGFVSLAFIRQNPDALAPLGLSSDALAASSSSSSDESPAASPTASPAGAPTAQQSWLATPGYQAGVASSGAVHDAAWRPQTAAERTGRDLLYTLIYSIIMLNTDLHNPAIHPKLMPSEYAASCRRCVQLSHLSDEYLFGLYHSVASRALTITPGRGLPPRPTSDDASRIATADSLLPSMTAEDLTAAAEAAARAAQAAQVGSLQPTITIDWNVAYWNLVDASRYMRAEAWRRVATGPGGGGLRAVVVGAALAVAVAALVAKLRS